MQKVLTYLKTHKIISGVILLAFVFGGYQWYHKAHAASGPVQYLTQPAAKTTITVSVSASGQVSAENKIDLKPGSSGALTQVNVKAGDTVKEGQVLAVVDQRSNSVAIMQARAALASAQASYDKLVAGLTGTDLQLAQMTVDQAQEALDKANQDYNQTVTDQARAVAKAYSDYLNSGLSPVASNNLTTATVTLSGSYNGTSQGHFSINLYMGGDGVYYTVSGLGNGSGLLQRGVALALGNGLYLTFGTSGTIETSTNWEIDVPNITSSTYATNGYAYQTALDNQTQALSSAQNDITSAQNTLKSAQLNFQAKTAAPANADVAQAKAKIAQAQANLSNADVNYDNNVIKAPFDGVVAALNNQRGDQVTASTVVATVITHQKLAQVSLNEVDASKIKVGEKANLTFDALDNLSIVGNVAEVDTIGTVSQGVVTYTAKVGFDSQDDRIKPGMSTSAAIITDVKTDVVAVPSSAVKSNGNGDYVQVMDANGQPQNRTVTVGISNDTDTEIASGLTEGDTVVVQTINAKTTGTTAGTSTNRSSLPGLGGAGGRAAGGGGGQFFISK